MVAVSGSFSGLLSFGLFQVETSLHGVGRSCHHVKCIADIIVAITVLDRRWSYGDPGGHDFVSPNSSLNSRRNPDRPSFILPTYPAQAGFLTPEEKAVGVIRLMKDSSDTVNAEMTLKEYFEPAKDWETWVWGGYCLVSRLCNRFKSCSADGADLWRCQCNCGGLFDADHRAFRLFHRAHQSDDGWTILGGCCDPV